MCTDDGAKQRKAVQSSAKQCNGGSDGSRFVYQLGNVTFVECRTRFVIQRADRVGIDSQSKAVRCNSRNSSCQSNKLVLPGGGTHEALH